MRAPFLIGRLLFGGFFLLPQYLQLVHGLSPLRAGLWTLPWSLAFIVGSAVTPPLSRRMRPALLMSGGLLLSAVGFILLARVTPTTGFVMFATATFIFTLGSAPVFTLTNDVIIASAPPERAGAASGISETCAELGGALGIAVFGSIGIMLYRSGLATALPSGLPPSVLEEVTATLGGAVSVAEKLPSELGAAVTDAARAAFLRGLRFCAIISGVGAIALAILAATTFRGARAATEHSDAPDGGLAA